MTEIAREVARAVEMEVTGADALRRTATEKDNTTMEAAVAIRKTLVSCEGTEWARHVSLVGCRVFGISSLRQQVKPDALQQVLHTTLFYGYTHLSSW